MGDDNKGDEKYAVDPNSGAAPQPGGWAGAHAVELGHAAPVQEAQVEVPSHDAQMGVVEKADDKEDKAPAKKAAAKKASDKK